MNILLIGSGGREHALAWRLALSEKCTALYCAPGNAGIEDVAECVDIKIDDIPALVNFAKNNNIDFVVVGPEGGGQAPSCTSGYNAGLSAACSPTRQMSSDTVPRSPCALRTPPPRPLPPVRCGCQPHPAASPTAGPFPTAGPVTQRRTAPATPCGPSWPAVGNRPVHPNHTARKFIGQGRPD